VFVLFYLKATCTDIPTLEAKMNMTG